MRTEVRTAVLHSADAPEVLGGTGASGDAAAGGGADLRGDTGRGGTHGPGRPDKQPEIIADTLACLFQAQATPDTDRVLEEATHARAQNASALTHDQICREWLKATDPRNLRPKVPKTMRDAADLLRRGSDWSLSPRPRCCPSSGSSTCISCAERRSCRRSPRLVLGFQDDRAYA